VVDDEPRTDGLLLLVTAFTPNRWAAAALLIVCFGVMDGMLPASWAICLDVGKRIAGAVSGAMTRRPNHRLLCMVLYGYMVRVRQLRRTDADLRGVLFVSAVLFASSTPLGR